MRIKLHDHYQNANGVRLAPGEYDSTDERLQGLAGYLVATEHAIALEEPVVEPQGADGDRDEEDAPPADNRPKKRK